MSEIPEQLSYTPEHEWITHDEVTIVGITAFAVEELGEIVFVDESLETTPEALGEDPYGDGWLFKMKTDGGEYALLDADGYRSLIES